MAGCRRRFFVPRGCIRDEIAFLPPDQVHHLRDVLRLKAGAEVEVFDGTGAAYTGKVQTLNGHVVVQLREELPTHGNSRQWTTLAPALIRSDRFEWMLEKATELGVDEVIPLETRFCEIRIPRDRLESRLERWRRIVQESSKQCRRISVPCVRAPVKVQSLIGLEQPQFTSKLLFYEKTRASCQMPVLSDRVLICTGPEGGWDETEVGDAGRAGFMILSLGSRVLRAETAAIVALTIVQYSSEAQRKPGL